MAARNQNHLQEGEEDWSEEETIEKITEDEEPTEELADDDECEDQEPSISSTPLNSIQKSSQHNDKPSASSR